MADTEEYENIRKEDIPYYQEAFKLFDKDNSTYIEKNELDNLLRELNIKITPYKLRAIKDEYGNTIDFNEFLQIVDGSGISSGAGFLNKLTKRKVEQTGGTSHSSSVGTKHSYSKSEAVAFTDWMNIQLDEDEDLKKYKYIPLDISNDCEVLFKKVKSGVLLCKLINATVANTIDDRVINKTPDSIHAIHENQTLAINSAISIGCRVVNIGPEDLASGKPHLVLGLLWQIIRIGLFSHITISEVPGLRKLVEDEGSIEEQDSKLRKMTPEEILILWVNYHLEKAGSHRRITNFGEDIEDSEVYHVLLTRLASQSPDIAVKQSQTIEHIQDYNTRADKVLKTAQDMGCKRFITAKDIVDGNEKLNMAFVANLFNTHPCLPTDGEDDDGQNHYGDESDVEETREEKTYRNWMNSLGANPFVTWIYADLHDGHILFQLYDRIQPGIVSWDRVASRKACAANGGYMKKIGNCNYAVEIGKNKPFCFSLVGIQGSNINEGNEKLTQSLLWQMMAAYTLTILSQLKEGNEKVVEGDIIEWAQLKLQKANSEHSLRNFTDKFGTQYSLIVIDLVDWISKNSSSRKRSAVDYKLVNNDEKNDEEKMQNARYALSVARKIGAQIYALPEDLVEVNKGMLTTVFACLWACDLKKGSK